jgi:pimeloyl-ACP methyl ester carboxylesterase
MRVYYPSLDGSPRCAPFLTGPGKFPLVIFLHGQCGESDHYTRWFRLPAILARSGFIVAIPQLAGMSGTPWDIGDPTYSLINRVISWMRSGPFSQFLMPPPTLGIIGHSYGALYGGQLALSIPATAYVSLGGVWNSWRSPRPLDTLPVPKLFALGTQPLDIAEVHASLSQQDWNALLEPKYSLILSQGEHWDYVPASDTTCDLTEVTEGRCHLVADIAADIAALFLSNYMPPEEFGASFPGAIPDNLMPPAVTLTTQQQFFAGGHLAGLNRGSSANCAAWLSGMTPNIFFLGSYR